MITATVVCWLLLLSVGVCQEAVLTPSEYVAYEGEREFTFQCSVTLPGLRVLLILVDGEQLSTDSLTQRRITVSEAVQLPGDPTTYQRNITISATQANRNTTIECVGFGNTIVSDTATCTFMVQGLLDPPTITEPVEHSTTHLILTWTPPFTLDITDLDPDITYRVCNNDTNTCVNTADTSYTFPATCFPVEYSVSACNPVGYSENSTIIPQVFIQATVVVYVQEVELDGRGGNVNVTCVFASGAKGCRVTIVGEGGSLQQMEAARKDDSQISASVIFTGLTNGTFLVAVGDTEADGSFDTGRQPASQFYTVTDAPPPSPLTTESSAAPSPKPTPVLLSPATGDDDDEAISIGVTVGVVGSMLLVTATVVVVVITTAVCVVRRSKNTGGIEMRENASYEMVVTRQQQEGVHRMERCPAYEVARRQN